MRALWLDRQIAFIPCKIHRNEFPRGVYPVRTSWTTFIPTGREVLSSNIPSTSPITSLEGFSLQEQLFLGEKCIPDFNRERKMRTNFFCTNFLNTARGPGHPGKIPGTSQILLFETQGRQTFEGEHELFGRHPFAWKTPTPLGGLRTQKVNLCALFSFLNEQLQRIRHCLRDRWQRRSRRQVCSIVES